MIRVFIPRKRLDRIIHGRELDDGEKMMVVVRFRRRYGEYRNEKPIISQITYIYFKKLSIDHYNYNSALRKVIITNIFTKRIKGDVEDESLCIEDVVLCVDFLMNMYNYVEVLLPKSYYSSPELFDNDKLERIGIGSVKITPSHIIFLYK